MVLKNPYLLSLVNIKSIKTLSIGNYIEMREEINIIWLKHVCTCLVIGRHFVTLIFEYLNRIVCVYYIKCNTCILITYVCIYYVILYCIITIMYNYYYI